MIYLDYAAHTPVDPLVAKLYLDIELKYLGNPNSTHPLGKEAKNKLDQSTFEIANLLGVKANEIVYTSGASESNNLAIKGIVKAYPNNGRHIITTYLEHASITGPITALVKQGYEVDFVDINSDGSVDLEHLEELIRADTILVSIGYIDSEIGIIQPIAKIAKILEKYPNTFFHVDATQAIGKVPVVMTGIDLMSCSAHKFYGLVGLGILFVRDLLQVEPLIHGGISTTPFRSGTPTLALVVGATKALELAIYNLSNRYEYVKELNDILKEHLNKIKGITFNCGSHNTPYILNLSIKGYNANKFIDLLAVKGYCISSKSACCSTSMPSRPVYALTKDRKASIATLRIGLSHLVTKEQLITFLQAFDETCQEIIV